MEIELTNFDFEAYYTKDEYDDFFFLYCHQEDCKFYKSHNSHRCEIKYKDNKLMCKTYEPINCDVNVDVLEYLLRKDYNEMVDKCNEISEFSYTVPFSFEQWKEAIENNTIDKLKRKLNEDLTEILFELQ